MHYADTCFNTRTKSLMSVQMNRYGANSRLSKRGRRQRGATRRRAATAPLVQGLVLQREYPGQPAMELKVRGPSGSLSTTVTTGVISISDAITPANFIHDFSSRFAGFEEYRIVKAVFTLLPYGSTIPGIIKLWFDSDFSSAPTSAEAYNAEGLQMQLCSVTPKSLTYKPLDPALQAWSLVSSGTFNIGYVKVYTDNATYGAPIVATQVVMLTGEFTIQFRGYSAT